MDNYVIVRGKSYPVAMTVQAFAEISDLCPGKDISRMDEISRMPMGESMILMAKMAVAMSRAAESKRKYEEPDYIPNPLALEAITTLDLEDYAEATQSILNAVTAGLGGQTVEVAEQKKTKEKAAG